MKAEANETRVCNGFRYTLEYGKATITGYEGTEADLAVPSSVDGYPVTGIGKEAFEYKKIKSASLPDSVTEIGSGAFSGCEQLQTVRWSSGCTYIPKFCFKNSSVINITNADHVTSIGYSAFRESQIAAVNFPKVESIDRFAFEYSAIQSAAFGSALKEIETSAFGSCKKLVSVTGTTGLESIGLQAFENCTSLKSFSFPASLKRSGSSSFKNTGFSEIVYPENRSIATYMFSNCRNLKKITLSSNEVPLEAFAGCTALETVILNSPVESLGEECFANCSSLKTIFIPQSVTEIRDDAFLGCDLLSSISGYYGTAAERFAKARGITFIGTELTLSGAVVTLSNDSYIYNGYPCIPAVTVTLNGKALKEGEDYKVSYSSNTNPGTAAVTVSGIGAYKGSVAKNFTIRSESKPAAKKYTVAFQSRGGTKVSSQSIVSGKTAKKPSNPKRKKYSFQGWYLNGKKYNFKTKVAKNLTLTAKWKKVTVPKASISKATNLKGRRLQIKFRKITGAKGYEFQYSTSRSFRGKKTRRTAKTSYTLQKLKKGKTYYVRVRAYKSDSTGKRIYGKYSAVKKVKIRK